MGANTFFQSSDGKNTLEAFNFAKKDAYYDFGHRGYTGSLAEKDSYELISDEVMETIEEAMVLAEKLIDECDERIDDKWGPAGCIKFKTEKGNVSYLFFGWASS
ncbi:MAG TPA: hypothetical protein VMX17_07900 [Candidatus Glassbacteria bacterium]|nr:hypothetical protein [Candidatus Glassbacteria bacterium]